MLKIIKIIFAFLLVFAFYTSYSQVSFKPMKDTASFKVSMQSLAKKTTTIKSDFVQEKNLSVLSERIMSKGHFYFKKENKLRWEYVSPFQYLIILNGNNVMIKDGEKVAKYDVQSNKMFKEINDMMIGMVQGKLLSNKAFLVKYYEDEKYFIIESTPLQKNKKEFLKNIYLFFEKKDLGVSRIKIIEPSGDYTEINFINRQLNPQISDEKFIIK